MTSSPSQIRYKAKKAEIMSLFFLQHRYELTRRALFFLIRSIPQGLTHLTLNTRGEGMRLTLCAGENGKRSRESPTKSLIKGTAKVSYHGRRWYVDLASAFPLARHYRGVFG